MKKIAALTVCCTASFCLAGCGQADQADRAPQEASSAPQAFTDVGALPPLSHRARSLWPAPTILTAPVRNSLSSMNTAPIRTVISSVVVEELEKR